MRRSLPHARDVGRSVPCLEEQVRQDDGHCGKPLRALQAEKAKLKKLMAQQVPGAAAMRVTLPPEMPPFTG